MAAAKPQVAVIPRPLAIAGAIVALVAGAAGVISSYVVAPIAKIVHWQAKADETFIRIERDLSVIGSLEATNTRTLVAVDRDTSTLMRANLPERVSRLEGVAGTAFEAIQRDLAAIRAQLSRRADAEGP